MRASTVFCQLCVVVGLLVSFGARPAHARVGASLGTSTRARYARKALPSGGHELRKTWRLRGGVQAEHVMQFNKDGHRFLSQRSTRGANGKITYTHTSYNPDGSVRERGRYKRWTINGVKFSSSKRMDRAGKVTYSSQRAVGPSGKEYERSAYGGMVDVQKTWKAKNTTFGIYTRTFVGTQGLPDRVVRHRFGVKTR